MDAVQWGLRVATDARRGAGHVMRSAVLADALGARLVFADPGPVPAPFVSRGIVVRSEVARESAQLSVSALRSREIGGLVLDSYDVTSIEGEWFVACVDDLNAAPAGVAAVIAPGLWQDKRAYPPGIAVAAGPRYALIDSIFSRRPPRALGSPPHVLIAMGARDSKNVSAKALDGIRAHLPDVRTTVVIGSGAPHASLLERLASERAASLRVGLSPQEMAELLGTVDLAVGAGGVSFLERLAIGVVSVLVVLGENQREQAVTAAELGVALLAASHDEPLLAEAIGRLSASLLADDMRRTAMIAAGHALVDTSGAARAAAFLQRAHRDWSAQRA